MGIVRGVQDAVTLIQQGMEGLSGDSIFAFWLALAVVLAVIVAVVRNLLNRD